MVGIFSRFSGRRGHRRAQSAIDAREATRTNVDAGGSVPSGAHGFELAVEFKPVEHPTEPHSRDQPVTCPLPEPSILNDGRIWKERISSSVTARARADLPVIKEGLHLENEAGGSKPPSKPANRHITPSFSAPEHNIVTLLEECNAAGEETVG